MPRTWACPLKTVLKLGYMPEPKYLFIYILLKKSEIIENRNNQNIYLYISYLKFSFEIYKIEIINDLGKSLNCANTRLNATDLGMS